MIDRDQSFQSQVGIGHALDRLREARDILVAHGAPKAAQKVRDALKSAEGAQRHAQAKATHLPIEATKMEHLDG